MKVVRNEHPKRITFSDINAGELFRVNDKPCDNIFMKIATESDNYNSVDIETGCPAIFNDDMIVYPCCGEFVESNDSCDDDNYEDDNNVYNSHIRLL